MPAKSSYGPPSTPTPNDVRVSVANIRFTGPHSEYNPLYDRERELNINPPQWRKIPSRDEPISYVRRKKATIQLDITGSPEIPSGDSIWVKVRPSAELLRLPGTPITFSPASQTLKVANWDDPDYEQLTFRTSLLPNEVRLDQLNITWDFEYRRAAMDPWADAGQETTPHEIYITYRPSYKGFRPSRRPWKQVLKTACRYAHGANAILEVSTRVTTGIYHSREFNYDPTLSHSNFFNSQILLWRMLKDGWVDCMDGSNYYTILMRWLGINANQIKINRDVFDQFVYKELRPITTTKDLNMGWGEDIWNFHQVGIFKNVYDPIIMIDKTGTPRVPTDMTQPDYKRAIFDRGDFVWDVNALVTSVY